MDRSLDPCSIFAYRSTFHLENWLKYSDIGLKCIFLEMNLKILIFHNFGLGLNNYMNFHGAMGVCPVYGHMKDRFMEQVFFFDLQEELGLVILHQATVNICLYMI